MDCFPCIQIPARIQLPESTPNGNSLSTLARFIRKYYAPFILRPLIKGIVVLIFGGFFVMSVMSMQHIELGLGRSRFVGRVASWLNCGQIRGLPCRRIPTLFNTLTIWMPT
jgi:hypothetical protein